MRTKSLLTLAIALCITLTSFGQSKAKMTPLEYNDYLSSVTDSLFAYGTEWGQAFASIAKETSPNYAKLKEPRKKIAAFVTRKKAEIAAKPAIGVGGEGMKQSIMSFLNFEMKMVEKAFIPFEDLASNVSDEELQKMLDNLNHEASGEEAVLEMVRSAQVAFANQNDFVIEGTTEE